MNHRDPALTDALLHRAETDARAAGHKWKQQLCKIKRAENLDRNTEPVKQRYHNQPRTLREMNRRN